ncbi:uncharacterized protein LOC112468758 [Temnothorax curvispinosus]|uniref:Uncharacterized protein LOC112468758 n=1 Tax=Temnothorax curvispinosus TaxID=300111 RepID=A0A6J1RHQ1_9HYME|nr:uncharacterized protein LOC112468758 [Temnothorax curvispinosus]
MRFATWHVRSLFRQAAFREVVEELTKYRIELCALQEIRWPGKEILYKKDSTLFYSGSTDRKNQFDTGIFVSNKLSDKVTDFESITPRIRMHAVPHNITIISAHAPTEDKSVEEKTEFYRELEEAYDSTPSFDIKIILEDFNSKIGKEKIFHPTIGIHSLYDTTSTLGSWFLHKNVHKGTWITRRTNGKQNRSRPGGYEMCNAYNRWECAEAIRTKNKAREKCLNKETRIPIDNYREARKNAKKLLRRKKRSFLREKLKSIKKERTLSGELATSQEEIIQRCLEHFTDTFAVPENEEDNTQAYSTSELREYAHLPTITDIKEAVKSLRDYKAPGIDTITEEMLKNAGNAAYKVLHWLVELIWQEKGPTPEDWMGSLINPIPKKGDLTES